MSTPFHLLLQVMPPNDVECQHLVPVSELFANQENDADGADRELPNSSSALAASPGSSHSVPDEKTKDPLLDNQEKMAQVESRSNSSGDEADDDKKD